MSKKYKLIIFFCSLFLSISLIAIGNGYIKYTSRHGFCFQYPTGWFVDADTIEQYSSIVDAERYCANHLEIYNYNKERELINSNKKNELKIEFVIFNDKSNERLSDQLIKGKETIDISKIVLGNRVMYKIISISDLNGDKVLSVAFKEQNWFVLAYCYPFNSLYVDEFLKILGTIQFNK